MGTKGVRYVLVVFLISTQHVATAARIRRYGALMRQSEQLPRAAVVLGHSCRADSLDAEAFYLLGLTNQQLGNFSAAEANLVRAAQLGKADNSSGVRFDAL